VETREQRGTRPPLAEPPHPSLQGAAKAAERAARLWSPRHSRPTGATRFDADQERIRRHGNSVILEPVAQDWAWLEAVIGPLDADFAQAAARSPLNTSASASISSVSSGDRLSQSGRSKRASSLACACRVEIHHRAATKLIASSRCTLLLGSRRVTGPRMSSVPRQTGCGRSRTQALMVELWSIPVNQRIANRIAVSLKGQ
jgi:antitoxin VapB